MCEMYEEETLAQTMASPEDAHEGIDELQLREFIAFQKKEGMLRRDVDLRIQHLMEKYDPEETGKITLDQFDQLKLGILRSDSSGDAMAMLESVTKQCAITEKTVATVQAQLTAFEASQAARLAALEELVKQIAERVDAQPAAGSGGKTEKSPSR